MAGATSPELEAMLAPLPGNDPGNPMVQQAPRQRTSPELEALLAPPQAQQGGGLLRDLGQSFVNTGKAGMVALHRAGDVASFGLIDRAASAIDSGISQINPLDTPRSPSQSYASMQDTYSRLGAEQPAADILGAGVGMVAGGVGLTRGAAKLIGAGVPYLSAGIRAMAPVEGAAKANVAKAALAGGSMAGADAAIHGDRSVRDSIVVGAIGGPIMAKGLGLLARYGGPVADRAAGAITGKAAETGTQWADIRARRWNQKPADLLAAADNLRAMGHGPQMLGALADAHSTGVIRDLARMNPQLTMGLQDAAAAYEAAQPARLSAMAAKEGQAVTPLPAGQTTPPASLSHVPGIDNPHVQDYTSLDTARRGVMDTAMGPIRAQTVALMEDDAALLEDILRIAPPRRGTPLAKAMGDAMEEIAANGHTTKLTVGDMDTLRKVVAARATGADAHAVRELATEVADLTGSQSPEYADALARYRGHSDYLRGFEHGASDGGTLGNIGLNASANDRGFLQSSIQSPLGLEGFASGVTARVAKAVGASESAAKAAAGLYRQDAAPQAVVRQALGPARAAATSERMAGTAKAQEALSSLAPSRVTPEPGPRDAGAGLATAAGHAALGWTHAAMNGAMRILGKMVGRGQMPEAAQAKLLEFLASTDPKVQAQGVALMQRAGADAADILGMQQIISGMAGAAASRAIIPRQ